MLNIGTPCCTWILNVQVWGLRVCVITVQHWSQSADILQLCDDSCSAAVISLTMAIYLIGRFLLQFKFLVPVGWSGWVSWINSFMLQNGAALCTQVLAPNQLFHDRKETASKSRTCLSSPKHKRVFSLHTNVYIHLKEELQWSQNEPHFL